MKSISFDRAASFYDDTRKYPSDVAQRVTQTIHNRAPGQRPILEAGVGTGRIAMPLIADGANVFGVDLSRQMMDRFHSKLPNARITQADVSRLPFPDATFGSVYVVHLLHLVAPWREALREFKRVLTSDGILLLANNQRNDPVNTPGMGAHWRALVEARGHSTKRPGVQSREELLDELNTIGMSMEVVDIGHWTVNTSPQEYLDRLAARIWSETWLVPEDVSAEILPELREWTLSQFADIDQQITMEFHLSFDIVRF